MASTLRRAGISGAITLGAVAIASSAIGCTRDFFGQLGNGGAGGAPTTTTTTGPGNTTGTASSMSSTTGSNSTTTTSTTTSGSTTSSTVASTSSGGMASVDCNGNTCLEPEVCCQGVGQPATGCAGTCSGSDQPFACDGPEDCPGTICCHHQGQGSACAPSCNGNVAILCHLDGDCGGGSCTDFGSFPGLKSCN